MLGLAAESYRREADRLWTGKFYWVGTDRPGKLFRYPKSWTTKAGLDLRLSKPYHEHSEPTELFRAIGIMMVVD